MKVKFLLLVAVLTTIFTSCQNTEEPKEISKPGANGNFRIEIVGNQAEQQASRSSGTIQFEGGTASGAGLYNSKDKANVSATPDDGYEIDYFFGGPESEPKKYDNANSGASSFQVDIDGQDHLFHVGFKKKERTLTINAESGGSVTPSGKDIYQVNKPITITATAKPGYKFAGWEINEGDVTIADKSNANTTATLNSLNSTITAKFIATVKDVTLTFGFRSSLDKYPYPTGVWSHTGAGVTPWRAWANDFTVELSEAVPYDIRVTIYLYANDYIELENDITDYISTNTYAAVFTIKANQTSISSPTLDEKHTFKEMYGSVTTSWTEAVYAYDIIVLENETNGEYNLTAKWIDVAGDDWQETTY